MDLLVEVIEVIRVIGGITTTGVIRVRFPIRDRLDRLAPWRFAGRSDAVALKVAPTEDADGESLAGGFSAGGVAREGSKKSKLGWKSGKVDRNIGAIFWEKHRFVPHGGARAAAMEVSEALRVITV